MPVEFLSDEQAGAFGRFAVVPSQVQLERFFFLDDHDLGLVGRRRGGHNRLGFAVQLSAVRFVGTFVADLKDVPDEVIGYVAGQLEVDAAGIEAYTRREKTKLEHQWEIAREVGYRDFGDAEAELAVWVDDRAWTTGEGPLALFDGAVGWLRERRVLLPGASVLARLVARERDAATMRVWTELAQSVSGGQARLLRGLLVVPDGARRSELDRLRKAESVTSGAGMVRALRRVSDIGDLRLARVDVSAVPRRRVVALARYGMAAKATALRRHLEPRQLATLVATVRSLEARAVDDALELFDLLMTNDLLARAARESRKEKLRRYPRLSKDAGKLAAAVGVLLDALEDEQQLSLDLVWEEIESMVSRAELRLAVTHLLEVAGPPDADPDGEWRTALVDRFASVRGFVGLLCETIEFGATAQAAGVLEAMTDLPGLLATRTTARVPAGYLDARRIAEDVVPAGWWQRLVFSTGRPDGTVDRAAYVFCVLEQFHRHLLRRDIHATPSARWGDPRASLLAGPAWDAARGPALNSLGLPEDPSELVAEHSRELDGAWRALSDGLVAGSEVHVDDEGRLHADKVDAIPDPPSLVDLRCRLEAMLPRVDLPDLILEVMAWHPEFVQAFTGLSGGRSRLADLHVSIAAALTAHALNVGYVPVISDGVPALTRGRISHVDQNYPRPENYAAANTVLIAAQDSIALARQWGGGLVAGIITDTGSYSDIVFALLTLLGFDYRPQLADLPDAKLWRILKDADYGPLNTAARGKIDPARIQRRWPDILRVVCSIHTGNVAAYDILRVLAPGGTPTQLGDALAHYGRIFKTLHVLSYVDDEPYRRDIKGMRNLQEGRHDLARTSFHGQRGELRHGYRDGMEDQLGALGLILNTITLWNTVYLDHALAELRAAGYPVLDADVARLSPYMRRHINFHGHYAFTATHPGGAPRALRDPDAPDED